MPCAGWHDGRKGIGYSNDDRRRLRAIHAAGGARCCLQVPNGLAAEQAALTEPLAVGLHAVANASGSRRDVPLVVGCGPVGLAVIAGAENDRPRTRSLPPTSRPHGAHWRAGWARTSSSIRPATSPFRELARGRRDDG